MKKYIISLGIIIFTIVALLLGFSCKKKTEPAPAEDPAASAGNTSNINSFFTGNASAPQTFTINSSVSQTITGTRAVVIIPSNAFVVKATNAPVTGTVQITMKEIYSKKDMILNKAQTMTNNNYILNSAGEMNIMVKQGSNDLKLASGKKLSFKVLEPASAQTGMMVFNGALNANQQLIWTQSPSTPSVSGAFDSTVVGTGYYYNFDCDSLGWVNCDALYCYTCPVTNYTVTLSGSHDRTNTSVFVVYPSINGASHLWPSNTNGQQYPVTNYISNTTQMTIVAISEINGTYYSTFQNTTPTNGAVYNLTLTATTNAAILTQLNSL
jgi:hypothetical protein